MDMFSGLTNQMSSWMGGPGKKPEDESRRSSDGKVTSPSAENEPINAESAEKKDISPTKGGGGKLEMFSNVRSQMTGWLGSVGKKEGDPGAPDQATAVEEVKPESKAESPTSEKSVKGSPVEQKEDDDNSSATGGADSEPPGSEGEELAGEDKDGNPAGIGGVSTKAIAGAKTIGSFFFSAVNKAGIKVSEASAKIKKSVEENSLLGEFNRDQEAFIKEKEGKGSEAALAPWVGYPEEESLKEEILSLSTDRRNFVRSPPSGVQFQFDYESSYPMAMATLAEDPNLEKMRFELVPKVINEETFWRNYFYRVSLIRQSNELSSMAQEGGRPSQGSSRASSVEGEAAAKAQEVEVPEDTDSPTHEFVSDEFRASSRDMEEVREGMKKLGMEPKANEEEWEKELQAELQDYEVVNDGDNQQDHDWENEIQEMLDAEDSTDLK